MTSKTLTGKKKEMEADAGDKYQVDVLSNAEVWVPKENEDLDLSTYFSSQVMYYKMLFLVKSHIYMTFFYSHWGLLGSGVVLDCIDS